MRMRGRQVGCRGRGDGRRGLQEGSGAVGLQSCLVLPVGLPTLLLE